ncbi:MAG: hypothetical protein DRJ32_01850 [Thermoprotei archaeon]|nr:MAG: hypothetical protein DRJ32_01850 [Thermoprotei archaeon]
MYAFREIQKKLKPKQKASLGRAREIENKPRVIEVVEIPKEEYHVIETKSGKIAIGSNMVTPFDRSENSILYPLTPLFEYEDCQEIFINEKDIVATMGGRRFKVKANVNVQELIENIAISTGTTLNLSRPYGETYVDVGNSKWRIYLKLREREIHCAKITRIPSLMDYDPLLAARIITLLLRPSVLCICGPTGSGKTTLLNSIILGIHYLYPHLKISVIEQVRELILPPSALISRAVAYGDYDVTFLLRQAFRYERPSVIVLGELRSENIETWFEISKGLASVTTMHANSLEDAISFMAFKLNTSSIEDLLSIVNCFILMRKIETAEGVSRVVDSVYVAYDGRLVDIYREGRHVSEDIFKKMFERKLIVGDFNTEYEKLKSHYSVNLDKYQFYEPIIIK